jgi:hypothetical protein
VFATNALPDRYPERAVDGQGGFFHVNRPDFACFVSEKKRYEYWQIQVADITAPTGTEILALEYFPPLFNRLRNIGIRFQLLDKSQNVLSQYVLKEGEHAANELWVDFRIRGPDPLPPIIQYCFPRIETIGTTANPVGIEQDENGNLYISDSVANRVYTVAYTSSTDTFGPPVDLFTLNSPFGIANADSLGLVVGIPTGYYTRSTQTNRLPLAGLSAPGYGILWDKDNLRLFVSFENGVGSTDGITNLTGLNRPTGLAIRTVGGVRYLYVACRNDFCVRAFHLDTRQEDVTKRIGVLGQPLTTPVTVLAEEPTRIRFGAPMGLATDDAQNLYIADEATHTLYITAPDTSSSNRSLVYRLAGTGVSGFSELATQPATECMLNRPQNILFHAKSGDILFTDMANGRIRRIRTSSKQRILVPQNPTVAPVYPTTTLGQVGSDPAVPRDVPIVKSQNRDRETIREFKAPARIEMLD